MMSSSSSSTTTATTQPAGPASSSAPASVTPPRRVRFAEPWASQPIKPPSNFSITPHPQVFVCFSDEEPGYFANWEMFVNKNPADYYRE